MCEKLELYCRRLALLIGLYFDFEYALINYNPIKQININANQIP